MKLIIAIIQPHKLDDVMRELDEKEIYLKTVTNVLGSSVSTNWVAYGDYKLTDAAANTVLRYGVPGSNPGSNWFNLTNYGGSSLNAMVAVGTMPNTTTSTDGGTSLAPAATRVGSSCCPVRRVSCGRCSLTRSRRCFGARCP